MAQKLETVEDFVRVAKALENSNAQPHEYEVKSFGYCTLCEKFAAYRCQYGPAYLWEQCLGCGFERGAPIGHFKSFILKDDMVPAAFKDEVDRLHSREQQHEFFLEALQARVGELQIERSLAEAKCNALDIEKSRLLSLPIRFGLDAPRSKPSR